MEKNKKLIKARSANKNSDKIKKIKININNKKKEKSNNKINLNSHKNSNNLQNIFFKKSKEKQPVNTFNSNLNLNSKINFDLEYDKLENLCNKKSNRGKKEIKDFMEEQKKKMINDKAQKKLKNSKIYKKIFINYRELEKEIKNININNKLKKKEETNFKIKENNLNDKSNGSFRNKLENKKFNNNYYFGCLDVKKILSKRIIIQKKQSKNDKNKNAHNNTEKK